MKELKVDITCHTDGGGLWSRKKAALHITKIVLHTWNYEGKNDAGHLEVFFSKRAWNTDKDGLIYTDQLFEKELREQLKAKYGLPECISYSEQGMQGWDYVDFDAEGPFIKKFFELTGVDNAAYKPPKPKSAKKIKAERQASINEQYDKKLQTLRDAMEDFNRFVAENYQ